MPTKRMATSLIGRTRNRWRVDGGFGQTPGGDGGCEHQDFAGEDQVEEGPALAAAFHDLGGGVEDAGSEDREDDQADEEKIVSAQDLDG